MITKLNFFRPDRRFVNDMDFNEKFTCLVQDEFMKAESLITVPVYLTVFQHHVPKACLNNKTARNKNNLSPYRFQEKICFYLVGSEQAPRLTKYFTNTQKVDRIEFKGHIGYEHSVFGILSQLPALRKVSFFINPCKQKHFTADLSTDIALEDDQQLNGDRASKNLLVTNLKIIFENCTSTSCCYCAAGETYENQENFDKTDKTYEDVDKNEHIKVMISRLLTRIVKQCPNIKRLCMDVPNFDGLGVLIVNSMKNLTGLKPTQLLCVNDNILVQTDSNLGAPPIPDIEACLETKLGNADILENISKLELEDDVNADNDKKVESNKFSGSTEEPENTNCLIDMSKLLGSMLGIPTSTFPSPSLPQLSIASAFQQACGNANIIVDPNNDTVVPQHPNNLQPLLISELNTAPVVTPTETISGSDCPMNSTTTTNIDQPIMTVSSSSVVKEVTTYAAAAASAAAVINTTTATSTLSNNMLHRYQHHHNNQHHHQRHHRVVGGNDDVYHHPHHRYHHHHINEGSRTTFLRNGEGTVVATAEEEFNNARSISISTNNNRKNPSDLYVADLGKPVYISSTSCKSPLERGVLSSKAFEQVK